MILNRRKTREHARRIIFNAKNRSFAFIIYHQFPLLHHSAIIGNGCKISQFPTPFTPQFMNPNFLLIKFMPPLLFVLMPAGPQTAAIYDPAKLPNNLRDWERVGSSEGCFIPQNNHHRFTRTVIKQDSSSSIRRCSENYHIQFTNRLIYTRRRGFGPFPGFYGDEKSRPLFTFRLMSVLLRTTCNNSTWWCGF